MSTNYQRAPIISKNIVYLNTGLVWYSNGIGRRQNTRPRLDPYSLHNREQTEISMHIFKLVFICQFSWLRHKMWRVNNHCLVWHLCPRQQNWIDIIWYLKPISRRWNLNIGYLRVYLQPPKPEHQKLKNKRAKNNQCCAETRASKYLCNSM